MDRSGRGMGRARIAFAVGALAAAGAGCFDSSSSGGGPGVDFDGGMDATFDAEPGDSGPVAEASVDATADSSPGADVVVSPPEAGVDASVDAAAAMDATPDVGAEAGSALCDGGASSHTLTLADAGGATITFSTPVAPVLAIGTVGTPMAGYAFFPGVQDPVGHDNHVHVVDLATMSETPDTSFLTYAPRGVAVMGGLGSGGTLALCDGFSIFAAPFSAGSFSAFYPTSLVDNQNSDECLGLALIPGTGGTALAFAHDSTAAAPYYVAQTSGLTLGTVHQVPNAISGPAAVAAASSAYGAYLPTSATQAVAFSASTGGGPSYQVPSVPIGTSPGPMAVSPDGNTFYIAGGTTLSVPGDAITVVDAPTQKLLGTISVGRSVTGLALTHDGSLLIVAGVDAQAHSGVVLASPCDGSVLQTVPLLSGVAGPLAISEDGSVLVVLTNGGDAGVAFSNAEVLSLQ